MTRTQMFPPAPPKVTDLVIRQKTEAMIEYAYIALRQFPAHERHVLSAEIRQRLWTLLHLRPTHLRLRRSSITRITRTLRRLQGWYAQGLAPLGRIAASVQSWLAHAAHADTRGLARAVLGRFAFSRGEVRA